MKDSVPRQVAIWIDCHQAILLLFKAGPFGRSIPHGSGDGWSQCRVDAQQCLAMRQYYESVLSHLEPQDEILILGPGQAKWELRHQIEQQGGMKGKVVGLHYASKLVKVEAVFPTSEVWHAEKAGEAQVGTPIKA